MLQNLKYLTFSLFGLFFISACTNLASISGVSNLDIDVAPIVGAIAPDFELESIEGETVRLSDHRGKVVLINFWATWCGPCRVEMPALQNRFEAYDGELVILAVDNDETLDRVVPFVQELGLTFTTLLDIGATTQDLYLIRGYPTSVFVDPDGIIQIIHIGIMTEGQLDDYISRIGLGDPD